MVFVSQACHTDTSKVRMWNMNIKLRSCYQDFANLLISYRLLGPLGDH